MRRSQQLLNDPRWNKGTAFTAKERDLLGLHGLLPSHVSTIEEQVKRRYNNFLSKPDALSKYLFLSALQNRNEVLFYRLVYEHIAEMLPLIYTPTVGDVSSHFSTLYREGRGIYFSYPLRDKIEQIVANIPHDQIDVVVLTDGERILGLGDLGIGGMAIPVGKLALYTLFGGIHPERTLPVLIDIGTNNQDLLNDPLYLGWRHPRMRGAEYEAFIDAVVKALHKRYPKMLLQWEDFAKPHAYNLLNRYRNQICSFNDDIQGTAAVALAAVLAAIKAAKGELKEQRIAIFGGGSAGMGICTQLCRALETEGLSAEEARRRFYIVDVQGLIHDQMQEASSEQKPFAQPYASLSQWRVKDKKNISLQEVIENGKITILFGTSAQSGAFTDEIILAMNRCNGRPIIFPLSNPDTRAEAHPHRILELTRGQAIVATGSPFAPFTYEGKQIPIAQCNNVYIFPGVGLGVIASRATGVSDQMFLTAAHTLSCHAPMLHSKGAPLFPALENLRAVSREIALAVAQQAQREGLAPSLSESDTLRAIDAAMWFPDYSV